MKLQTYVSGAMAAKAYATKTGKYEGRAGGWVYSTKTGKPVVQGWEAMLSKLLVAGRKLHPKTLDPQPTPVIEPGVKATLTSAIAYQTGVVRLTYRWGVSPRSYERVMYGLDLDRVTGDTLTMHAGCSACEDAVDEAFGIARSTGSVGATIKRERVTSEGRFIEHAAQVRFLLRSGGTIISSRTVEIE